MAGHMAVHGDRFSMVQGARSSKERGAKAQYYPLSPPQKMEFNPNRPIVNILQLPIRSLDSYWKDIKRLEAAKGRKTRYASIVRETGISGLPTCATSPAFTIPYFFPLDPFHLFYENCMPHIWDLWVSNSSPEEKIYMGENMASLFGEEIEKAMATLPPSFCGPVRNPYKKRQSQYKAFEWMALLHWYIVPIAWELGFDQEVIKNFAIFSNIIEYAMTTVPRTVIDLGNLFDKIILFLRGFEDLYVNNDPTKVSRCRLCIFQLIHIPHHIEFNGSIRIGSQATTERAIGEVTYDLKSQQSPYGNIVTNITEKSVDGCLSRRRPELAPQAQLKKQKEHLFGKIRISRIQMQQPEVQVHLQLIHARSSHHFEAHVPETPQGEQPVEQNIDETLVNVERIKPIFGEALVFYSVAEIDRSFVVYHPLIEEEKLFGRWHGEWSPEVHVLETSALVSLVGTWMYEDRVHILRKHPGLAHLAAEDAGELQGDGGEEVEP
ncbi:hypothetical protein BC834DRAFT_828555 [Gloeopeniophorella convolvens]|nr:hypothetical protein BC834DRAFT_828555 [Gloeopeniophorella convolvens]